MPLMQWHGTIRTLECFFSGTKTSCSNCTGFLEPKVFIHVFGLRPLKSKHRSLKQNNQYFQKEHWRASKVTSKNTKEQEAEKKTAKAFNNVVLAPIWDIELTHVAPAYLHLLLGIVKNITTFSSKTVITLTSKLHSPWQRMKLQTSQAPAQSSRQVFNTFRDFATKTEWTWQTTWQSFPCCRDLSQLIRMLC